MMFDPKPSYASDDLVKAILYDAGYHLYMSLAGPAEASGVFKLIEEHSEDKEIVGRCKEVLDYMVSRGKLTMRQLAEYDQLFIRS